MSDWRSVVIMEPRTEPRLCAALATVARAEAGYVPGRMSASVIEIPKLELADALLEARRRAAVIGALRAAYAPLTYPAFDDDVCFETELALRGYAVRRTGGERST